MEGMLLLVVLHPTASSMLSLKTQEAYRVDQEGQWEVDWDVKGGGSSFWIVFVQEQCCAIQGDQQQPQKRDSQWYMFPVTTTQLFVVACGSFMEWAYNIGFLSEKS